MAPKRRRSSNYWLGITQIILLTAALVMILFFRDMIANGASNVVGIFSEDDIQVQTPADPSAEAPNEKPAKQKPLDLELEGDLKIKSDANSAETTE